MSNELTVQNQQSNQVMFYSARGLNYDAILNKLDEEMPQGGPFPGDALAFDGKRGQWKWGFGKNGQTFDHKSLSFVFNMPNAVEGWQRFVTDEASGKTFPFFQSIVHFADVKKLTPRKELGDNDPEHWPVDNWGKKQDPWKNFTAVPIRVDGDTEKVHHLFLSTISGTIAFKNLVRDWAAGAKQNMGKLPVVNISVETRERKDTKETYDVPKFEIVAWDDPVAADIPNVAEQQASQVAIPDANVTAQTRDTVAGLQAEANASAEQEAASTTATVETIAAKAGAATGQRRSPSATPAKPAGLFAGAPGRRQTQKVS